MSKKKAERRNKKEKWKAGTIFAGGRKAGCKKGA
jgi:hypothetical protein